MALIKFYKGVDEYTPPAPVDVALNYYDLTKSERTADGTMQMEYIATKRRLDVSWKYMKDSDFQNMLSFLSLHKPFFYVAYNVSGVEESYLCYCGAINTKLGYILNGQRYWEEITIAFIEV